MNKQRMFARAAVETDSSETIGVARIFDWEGLKPEITYNDVIRNFQKRNFLWDKDIVE